MQQAVLFTLDRGRSRPRWRRPKAICSATPRRRRTRTRQAQRRLVDLAARGIATREQVDTSSECRRAALTTIAADRAAVDNARIQLQYATITAPLTGRTGAPDGPRRQLWSAPTTRLPLVVINQLVACQRRVCAMPEDQLPALKRYMAQGPVRVEVPAARQRQRVVARDASRFVDNAVDQTTGTIRVEGLVRTTAIIACGPASSGQRRGDARDRSERDRGTDRGRAERTSSGTVCVRGQVRIRRRAADGRVMRTQRRRDHRRALDVAAGEVVVTDGHLRLVPRQPRARIRSRRTQRGRP